MACDAGLDRLICLTCHWEAPTAETVIRLACLPMLVSPVSPPARQSPLPALGSSTTAVTGITGERKQLPPDLVATFGNSGLPASQS
jgi:hypothetical protein